MTAIVILSFRATREIFPACCTQGNLKLKYDPLKFYRACGKAAAGSIARSGLNIATNRLYDKTQKQFTKES